MRSVPQLELERPQVLYVSPLLIPHVEGRPGKWGAACCHTVWYLGSCLALLLPHVPYERSSRALLLARYELVRKGEATSASCTVAEGARKFLDDDMQQIVLAVLTAVQEERDRRQAEAAEATAQAG